MLRLGGSFAPPIDAETLAEYRTIAEGAPPELKEPMVELCKMVGVFNETPASRQPGTPHPVGTMLRGDGSVIPAPLVVPLDEAEIKRIWDYVPWDHECEMYRQLFETIPVDSPLRNPAFHLLWYAVELTRDREPMTKDKLGV